tara:strand:- start:73 stop:1113 length:1041 start_codon:yes stop_codon:yes gene_type:complete
MSLGKKKILSQGAAGGVVGTDNFNTVIWSNGVGQHQSPITGVGFQPDFVWIKMRNAGQNHVLTDSVRGATKTLESNTEDFEETVAQGLTAFNADGFALGNDSRFNHDERSGVAWCWYAPTAESISASGSRLASTIKKNVASGFSIVKYTGTGSAATVGHGLSSAEMYIVKSMEHSASWYTYHIGLDSSAPQDYNVRLNETAARQDSSSYWNDTAPTNSVFNIGTTTGVSKNNTDFIAYCFHSVAGYQKVGSYTGNRPSNVTVYTDSNGDGTGTGGFQPRFVMIKADANGEDWTIVDSTRGNFALYPNSSASEDAYTGVTFNSTGFVVGNSGLVNTSGANHIYLAIA